VVTNLNAGAFNWRHFAAFAALEAIYQNFLIQNPREDTDQERRAFLFNLREVQRRLDDEWPDD
jgi:hypothetical protein